MTILTIAVLGAIGAILRAVVTNRLPAPVGTLTVNLAAAFLLGLSVEWDGVAAVALRVGLLGALSTWSTLAHQLADLLRRGRPRPAAIYLATTLVGGVACAWLGIALS
jgi:CrcB protein